MSQEGMKSDSQSGVTMYTTTWCGDCHVAKRLFAEAGVSYKEVDIEADEDAAQLVMRHNDGKRRVPTIEIGGQFHGNPPAKELKKLIAAAAG